MKALYILAAMAVAGPAQAFDGPFTCPGDNRCPVETGLQWYPRGDRFTGFLPPVYVQPNQITGQVFDKASGEWFYCPGDPRCLTTRGTPPHRYTVAEIDRMRVIVTAKIKCEGGGCGFHMFDLLIISELRVQTLVAAGITIEELERAP